MNSPVLSDSLGPARKQFVAEVIRLRREVRDAGQRLDRIEADMRRVLEDLLRGAREHR